MVSQPAPVCSTAPPALHNDTDICTNISSCSPLINGIIKDVMVKVADDLNKNWSEYDKDAFVNGWDIGNYVADYLTNRLGDECSSCSAKIFVPEENE